MGVEPTTCCLRSSCSAIELPRHARDCIKARGEVYNDAVPARALLAVLAALLGAWPSHGLDVGNILKKAGEKAQAARGKPKRSATSTAGVRGLGEDAGGESAARNFQAIAWLEWIYVSGADLDKFVRAGILAP